MHQWLGYGAAALVIARVLWGFIGTGHARFADFFPTVARLRAHLADLRAGRPDPHLGHNPLGALMMLALMALVIALGVTGYLQGTDRFWGEAWMQDTHALLADGLITLAAVHALAAILVGRREGVNLVAAMITGVKVRRRVVTDPAGSER